MFDGSIAVAASAFTGVAAACACLCTSKMLSWLFFLLVVYVCIPKFICTLTYGQYIHMHAPAVPNSGLSATRRTFSVWHTMFESLLIDHLIYCLAVPILSRVILRFEKILGTLSCILHVSWLGAMMGLCWHLSKFGFCDSPSFTTRQCVRFISWLVDLQKATAYSFNVRSLLTVTEA